MGLMASLLALLGCDRTPVYEDTRHLENPPPKPPNCPELPELKNVTLKDGSIADVRIVQFRETKLYVPTVLMQDHFVDKLRRRDGKFIYEHDLQKHIPDIHSDECPGLVHIPNQISRTGQGVGVRLYAPFGRIDNLDTGIGFGLTNPNQILKDNSQNFMSYSRVYLRYSDDVGLNFAIPGNDVMNTENWIIYRESALAFARWLATPPRKRDNDRIFILGAKNSENSGDTILN